MNTHPQPHLLHIYFNKNLSNELLHSKLESLFIECSSRGVVIQWAQSPTLKTADDGCWNHGHRSQGEGGDVPTPSFRKNIKLSPCYAWPFELLPSRHTSQANEQSPCNKLKKKLVMCLKAATLAFCTADNKTKQFTIFLTFPKSKGVKNKKSVASGQLQRGWKWQTVVPSQSMCVCLWQTFNHRRVNCEMCW